MLIDHKNVDDLVYRKDFQTQTQFDAKIRYYTWAEQMLHLGSFRSMRDQVIWEYHSDGMSRRKISERVGLEHSWCSRKIVEIRAYLTTSSQCALYG